MYHIITDIFLDTNLSRSEINEQVETNALANSPRHSVATTGPNRGHNCNANNNYVEWERPKRARTLKALNCDGQVKSTETCKYKTTKNFYNRPDKREYFLFIL